MADLAYREVYAMDAPEARQRLIQTYQETKSVAKTARIWRTSRQVVRKWVQRHQREGDAGLRDRSRRPQRSPRQTAPETEERVVALWQQTHYGRRRLSSLLAREGLHLSEHTIRHILRRRGCTPRSRKRRKPVYPARWAWEKGQPFALLQTDVKDIHDKDMAFQNSLSSNVPAATVAPVAGVACSIGALVTQMCSFT